MERENNGIARPKYSANFILLYKPQTSMTSEYQNNRKKRYKQESSGGFQAGCGTNREGE